MEIIEALKWRYATKKFDATQLLPEDKIEKLKRAFNLTATSFGLQPLKLVVVHNKDIQEQLMKFSYNQKQVGTASHVLVICIEKKVGKEFIENYFQKVKEVRETPEDILRPHQLSLVKDFEKRPVDDIRTWATHQAYLVLGALLTACAIEEIDSCPMEGFQSENYDQLLGLDTYNLQSVLVLPVGIRSEDDFFAGFKKVRRPLQETVIDMG